jgi:hypothetical protein
MEILLILLLIFLVDAFALLYGADSRDGINSLEWQRRAHAWSRLLSYKSR